MLFSEIYGSYYNAVSKLIASAVDGDLTEKILSHCIAVICSIITIDLLTVTITKILSISRFSGLF